MTIVYEREVISVKNRNKHRARHTMTRAKLHEYYPITVNEALAQCELIFHTPDSTTFVNDSLTRKKHHIIPPSLPPR